MKNIFCFIVIFFLMRSASYAFYNRSQFLLSLNEFENLAVKTDVVTLNNFLIAETPSWFVKNLSSLKLSFSARNKSEMPKHFTVIIIGLDTANTPLWAMHFEPRMSMLSGKVNELLKNDIYAVPGTLNKTKGYWVKVTGDLTDKTLQNQLKLLDEQKKIIKSNPNSFEPYFKSGNIYLGTKQYKEAIKMYKKGLNLRPEHVDARLAIITCYTRLRKTDKAIEEIKSAIKHSQNRPIQHIFKATSFFIDKKLKESKKEFEAYLRLEPEGEYASFAKEKITELNNALHAQ
jgi:tetratricopeptide (TPR) repeat protein